MGHSVGETLSNQICYPYTCSMEINMGDSQPTIVLLRVKRFFHNRVSSEPLSNVSVYI
ncbi:hypothetical protein XBJ2_1990002 [Xenorhabdus bovienii str. Jollieti]|uniref:Uncharacterized protein n=1 Tax=Xenorhabdus bovienii (strain SS-2004) TaxID=406818 RepID=D3V5Z9_XENBS|nr:hypothetical protein XBJ1_3960 [Xenorhabdus bovienii SS-2004]CDH28794.1 hypothetical protein XBJ2_1990002 [Xenorhabdus bovienii str. Jollieti]